MITTLQNELPLEKNGTILSTRQYLQESHVTMYCVKIYLVWLYKIDTWFPKSKFVRSFVYKMAHMSARQFNNTVYNILTGYRYYAPPPELAICSGSYFNPYAAGMVTKCPPFLKDKMIKFPDGVPASTPQMAYDLTTFLSFLQYSNRPDFKLDTFMYLVVVITI